MPERNAKIGIKLEGEDLQALKDFLEKFQGMSGPSGFSSGSLAGGQPNMGAVASPAAHQVHPTQASQAAATAGTPYASFGTYGSQGFTALSYDPVARRFFDPATGAYQIHPTSPFGGGSANPPASRRDKPESASLFEQLGGLEAGYEVLRSTREGVRLMAEAQVAGRPFYPERLNPALTSLGATAIGAGLGSIIPGVGTIVGLGVGSAIGNILSTYQAPLVEHSIKAKEIREYMDAAGLELSPSPRWENLRRKAIDYGDKPEDVDRFIKTERLRSLPDDVLEIFLGNLKKGVSIPTSIYEQSVKMNPIARDQFLSSLGEAWSSPEAASRFGSKIFDANFVTSNKAMLLYGSSYGRELQLKPVFGNLGRQDLAREMEKDYVDRIQSEGEDMIAGANVGLMSTKYSVAARYGGAQSAFGALPGALSAMAQKASSLRKMSAEQQKRGNPYQAQALELQAQQVEMQMVQLPETALNTLSAENSALTALDQGRASRSFESALYGGTGAVDLPWNRKTQADQMAIARLQGERAARKRIGMLSPAEDAAYSERIEDLQQDIEVRIPRQREQLISREKIASGELDSQRARASQIEGLLKSGVLNQAKGSAVLENEILTKRLSILQEILDTSTKLTKEERLQLETRIEQIKEDKARLTVTSMISTELARGRIAEHTTSMTISEATVALLKDATPAKSLDEGLKVLQSQRSLSRTYKSSADKLLAQGFAPDSSEVMELQEKAAAADLSAMNTIRSLGTVNYSPEQRMRLSALGTSASIINMGYGKPSDMRNNIGAQFKIAKEHLQDIDARISAVSSDPRTKDNKELLADLAEVRNHSVEDMAKLYQAYFEGWDQRLLSTAINMPGSGRLLMTRFTQFDAAKHGLDLAGMINTAGASSAHRQMYPELKNLLYGGMQRKTAGMGGPSLFPEVGGMIRHSLRDVAGSGMGLSATPVNVRVQVDPITIKVNTVSGAGSTFKATAKASVDDFRTLDSFANNKYAQKTPSG